MAKTASAYECLNKSTNPTIAIDNAENQQPRHRELVIQVSGAGTQTAYLKFQDRQFTWYNVPLGRVTTRKSDGQSKHNNILVPVIPRCYTTVDLDPAKADVPREGGFVYIYKGDYLWREFEVLAKGLFQEINLREYQGRDERRATVEKDNRILLPYRIEGKKETLSMCFSEIQWSWARINSMGGMDPNDFRINQDEPPLLRSDLGISAAQAASNRKARMQEIDLSGYDAGFPITPPSGNKARIENVDNSKNQSYHFKLHHKSQVPVVYIHDPLGIATMNVVAFYDALTVLSGEIEETKCKNSDYFKTAAMSYHIFFNEDLHALGERKKGQRGPSSFKQQGDGPDLLRKTSREIDQNYLEEILLVKRRKELRKYIRDIKRIHVEWLQGKYKGNPLSSSCSDFISVNAALLDYAELPAPDYIAFWAKIHTFINFLNIDPTVIDGGMDLKKNRDPMPLDQDPGVQYMDSLLDPAHPLHKAMFPNKSQIDEYKAEYKFDPKKPEPPDGKAEFRAAAFAASLLAPSLAAREHYKYFSEVAKEGKRIVSDIVLSFKLQWERSMNAKTTINADVLVRFAKAANQPEFTGLQLVKPGHVLNNQVVVDGKVSVLGYMSSSKAKKLIKKTKGNPAYVKVIDGLTKEAVGYMDPQQIANNKGIPLQMTREMYDDLFVDKTGKIAKARTKLVVVSSDSAYAREWHLPNTSDVSVTRTVKGIQFAGKILPPLVAVMEVFNLVSVTQKLRHDVDNRGKNLTRFVHALSSFTHATIVAAIALSSEKDVARFFLRGFGRAGIHAGKLLGNPGLGRAGATLGKNAITGTYKAFGKNIKFLGTFNAGLYGLAAVLATWDMFSSFSVDDDDAAIAYGFQAAASIGVGLAILFEAGATFLGLGPVGWLFLAIGIIAGIMAFMLTDTPLEKWAKHGPFAKTKKQRMTEEYYVAIGDDIHQDLMTLLMAPRVTVQTDYSTSPATVVVEVVAPGFEPEKSTLDIRATWEQGYTLSPQERAFMLTHPQINRGATLDQIQSENFSGIQQALTLLEWEDLHDKEVPGQVIGLRYRYALPQSNLQGTVRYRIRARAKHITVDQLIVPTWPDNDKMKPDDPVKIDPDVNGWAYSAELLMSP